VQAPNTDLEKLLRKLQDFERTYEAMSSGARGEFEAMTRIIQKRLAERSKPPSADPSTII